MDKKKNMTENDSAPLSIALNAYAQALETFDDGPQTLLTILLARDAVEEAQQKVRPLPAAQVQRLVALDAQFQELAAPRSLDKLPDWRQTLAPPASAWWWRLDERVTTRETTNDLPWTLLTGTFTLLTAALTTEILTRLWNGAPDTLSVFGSLLTLTLTASPLIKRGPDLLEWGVARLPKLKLKHRVEALAVLTGLAFTIVLMIRLALPAAAVAYNNQGFVARQAQNYAQAQRKFQRAVALHPDNAVAAYNLAEVYARLREPEQAQTWYQHAIAVNVDLALAYRGLGHLYNEQGQYAEAEAVLAAGLVVVGESPQAKADVVARYELLADLGWAYVAQERITLAQRALEDAVALEDTLKDFENAEPGDVKYRSPLPHYYLAQLYEAAGEARKAKAEWEACLSLIAPGWSGKMAWRLEAQEHLAKLKEALP